MKTDVTVLFLTIIILLYNILFTCYTRWHFLLTIYRLVLVAGNESYNDPWLIIRATIRLGIYGCFQHIAPIISIFVSLNSIVREISSFHYD